MNEKENFMRVMRGETPEWAPRFALHDEWSKYPPSNTSLGFRFIFDRQSPSGKRMDIWGVEYTPTEDTGGQALPTPGRFILDDIRKWRDVIKAPDLSSINWEAEAKKELDAFKYDRNEVAVGAGGGSGFFMVLMNIMGFTEGLCAMAEEPEIVKELFDYIADFSVAVAIKSLDYFKPDFFNIGDDTAAAGNPFISPEAQRELIKPFHHRLTKLAIDRGLPIMMHCCGRCEDYIDDWLDIGVTAWNPAQLTNDLSGIKKKYGNKLALCGCWDSSGPAGWYGAPEEVVRQGVRDSINTYGPGGGYMFYGSSYGPAADVNVQNKKKWITEEYEARRYDPYK